jgi:hypothetical protein
MKSIPGFDFNIDIVVGGQSDRRCQLGSDESLGVFPGSNGLESELSASEFTCDEKVSAEAEKFGIACGSMDIKFDFVNATFTSLETLRVGWFQICGDL